MSDSSPKLRSPMAAYGPVVIPLAVIGVALAVMFTLGSKHLTRDSIPLEEMTPPPAKLSPKEMQKRMGYGDPDKAREDAMKLIKAGKLSWFDLDRAEQRNIDRLTHNGGRTLFEQLVDEERSKKQPGK